MIRVNNLSFTYGSEPIFSGISFVVDKGQKVGLVGPNGSGKSTLFRLLSGSEMPDEGKIEILGQIENVPQEVKHDEWMEISKTAREYIDPYGIKKDFELREFLAGLEMVDMDLQKNPNVLSGGQKTKLAIIRAIILEPDILLLDEPTNFLDKAGKKWVMKFLEHYPKTLIIISHDLELLDKKIDKVLYLNKQTHKIDEYKGNYSFFVKERKIREELLRRKIEAEQKHIERMQKGLLKMAHFKSGKGVRQRLNLERRVEQAIENLPEMPAAAKKIRLELPEPLWVGSLPVWVKNINKSFGEKRVLTGVTLDIKRGERIALAGPNGAGKSTLIKIIMGLVEPDSGDVIRDGKLKIGYYSQEFENFDMNKTMMEVFRQVCEVPEGKARAMLGRFLFTEDKPFQKISTLSGGEKTRLAIALLLGRNFNLLILDEPTTYLDPLSQRIILEAIKEYKGSMLIVSHTPEFIEELHIDRTLRLPENKLELSREAALRRFE